MLCMVPYFTDLNWILVVNIKRDVIKIKVKKTDVYTGSYVFEVLLEIILFGLRFSWGNKQGGLH